MKDRVNRDGDHDGVVLNASDETALDALVGAGFDPEAVAPEHRERARKVASLLGLLDTEPGGSEASRAAMTERVIERVAGSVGPRSGLRQQPGEPLLRKGLRAVARVTELEPLEESCEQQQLSKEEEAGRRGLGPIQ